MLTTKKSPGFTIVELLIVIIVIAILATLIITAYNGVQAKARNTQRIAAAKDWQKIITEYVVDYGEYPTNIMGAAATYCLGDGYPTDWDTNSNGDCYATTAVKHGNSTWDAQLKLISPNLPEFNKTPVQYGDGTLRLGIEIRTDSSGVDGVPNYPMLVYYLEGANQDCGLQPIIDSSRSSTSGAINTSGTSSMTSCLVKLPDPSSL